MMFLVLPLAVAIGAGFLWACVRAIRAGQFDDLETPAHRALWEDDPVTDTPPGAGAGDRMRG